MENRRARLTAALAGLAFPARRWQLIAQAKDYGADAQTQLELQSLPEQMFGHLADVVRAVEARDAALGAGHLRVPVHQRKRDGDRRSVPAGALVVRPTRGRGPSVWPAELETPAS
ncbi:DUF2795 domain-containing protein [Pseudonocardia pini]|uniref:DUF2795 domain-containing protein n=1 Tax=Pseudonocardia pini TaxID=2758030 RepID=UPI0015F04899|nr:DUF2795 domain-containing protein [Pseudonocardia pini]